MNTWLQLYLIESVRENRCTRVHCSTCGATQFRRGLLDALAKETGRGPMKHLDRAGANEVVRGFAAVASPAEAPDAVEEAVRCVLYDLWSGVPMSVEELESLLAGTWSGEVLKRMKAHHAAREAARHAQHGKAE